MEATTPAGSIAGKITVESPVPTNNAIRYFTLVVKNQENITREVFVIQYPLEYITNIYAWYSYRDDFFYAAGRTNDEDGQSVPTTYEVQGDRISSATWSSGAWRLNKASTNGAFVSKVSGTQTSSGSAPIYYYYYDRSYFGDVEVQQSTAISKGNPRMYHVQIKATSDTYTVAIPKMNETTGYTEDTDDNSKLVSPSFMIASQLGAVSSGSFNNYEMAASHCREYVEVYKDPVTGETVHLTNWRLPTRAEVEIIIKFQNDSEVMDEVLKDKMFYDTSGGGITVTGGEPSYQPDFTLELLRLAKDAGISIAIETCGIGPHDFYKNAVDLGTTFLYDIKCVDPDKHLRLTGADNRQILSNLCYIMERSADVIIRIPLIPGCNDADEDIALLADLLNKNRGKYRYAEIMPYHSFGIGKSEKLGVSAQYIHENATDADISRWLLLFSSFGVDVKVSK